MNRLYAILMSGRTNDTDNYYYKRHTRPVCPDACRELVDLLFGALDDQLMHFVAAAVCAMVLHTTFRNEILALDPVNTYTPVKRHGDELLCDIVTSPETRRNILVMLDADIRERLQLANWPEFLGGVSLHLLRRIAK